MGGMIEITREEYRAYIEAQVKLDAIARFFEDDSFLSRKEFTRLTGFEFSEGET